MTSPGSYDQEVVKWRRALDLHALLDLVRDHRSGRADIVTYDAVMEYERRLFAGLIPTSLRLAGRCRVHRDRRQKPRTCIDCAEVDKRTKEIKFRMTPSRLKAK